MSKITKICSKNLTLLSLVFLFFFCNPVFAATEISEFEKYMGKEYGPEYFFAIQGEVFGQAAPGVQAVYVNGKPVRIDKNLNFWTRVTLKEGQKYLEIETRYKGLHFIKKYLVIRHPKAPKVFKIHVPKQEFQKIIKTKPVPRKKVIKKPEPKPKPKPSFGFKEREFKDRYTVKALSQAIKADDYGIPFKSPDNTLQQLNELLRTPNFYDIWKEKKKNVFITEEMQRLIDETSGYRHKPFEELTRLQQLKIIRLNRLLIEATYPLLSPKSLPEGVEAPADAKWLGFEFVAELEPSRFFVVRRINGKYFGAILDAKSNRWFSLQEITRQEFKDLLEKGKFPSSFAP